MTQDKQPQQEKVAEPLPVQAQAPLMTEEEAERIIRNMGATTGAPTSPESHNVHKFLNEVAISHDTTKTGNLRAEELGMPKLPVRTYKELELFCSEIADMDYMAKYFGQLAEITNATSLSYEGFLVKAAITQKKELADITPKKAENKGWFKKKDAQNIAGITTPGA